MEEIKVKRRPIRAGFTKTLNACKEDMKGSRLSREDIVAWQAKIESKWNRLAEIDQRIMILYTELGGNEEEYEEDYANMEEYEEKYVDIMARLVNRKEEDHIQIKTELGVDTGNNRRKYKLPKIELKKYNGDLKAWLGFWGQFRKIDEDNEISREDKFQYLLQSTEEGSKARKIVDSFPPSAESYNQAIASLKERFGREDLLVEIYIRELIGILLKRTESHRMGYLTKLYDDLETNIRALETLGCSKDNNQIILYPLIESCLPEELLKIWERNLSNCMETFKNSDGSFNKMEALMSFLKREVEGEQRLRLAKERFGIVKEEKRGIKSPIMQNRRQATATDLYVNSKREQGAFCNFCERDHRTKDCKEAINWTIEEKKRLLTQRSCCFLCLEKGHLARRCGARVQCFKCKGHHFAIMCQSINNRRKPTPRREESEKTNLECFSELSNECGNSRVLLQTLTLCLHSNKKRRKVRALIDTGSQQTYLSKFIIKEMGYQEINTEKVRHNLFGGVKTVNSHKRYKVFISDENMKFLRYFEALDQENICNHLPRIPEGNWEQELQAEKISLSDNKKQDDCDDTIHVLLGADVACKLFTGKTYSLKCGILAMETYLGWTIMGKPKNETNGSSRTDVVNTLSLLAKSEKISDLWTLDRLGILDPIEQRTSEDLREDAKQQFLNTLTRNADGRFIVSLPWIEGRSRLIENRKLAEKRLERVITQLKSKDKYKAYEEILQEWENKGIIEEIPTGEQQTSECYYLPHRPVYKENATTKMRPVFDASMKGGNSLSLNDCIEKGYNLIELIPSVISRFRLGYYGVTSDIEKAFLQIEVNIKDRDYLRFLWLPYDNPGRIKFYRHCRVVFGINASPFLLGATLNYLCENVPPGFKVTAEKLKTSMYVDNCVTSFCTLEEVEKFKKQAMEIMNAGKFNLRDWKISNSDGKDMEGKESADVNVLGLIWNTRRDTLRCDLRKVTLPPEQLCPTKRRILAIANKIFDPIGFSSPFTLLPKIILQECWKEKIAWDTSLPDHLKAIFLDWEKQIPLLGEIEIPRCISLNVVKNEAHIFCDASRQAYATCIYLKTINSNDIRVQLVAARARIAPLRAASISRLELLACCLGARLYDSMKEDLKLKETDSYFWTDSTNVLHWIRNEEAWSVFVLNRVLEIRKLTPKANWAHIPGSLNPADLPSRTCSVARLTTSRWWEGPEWLRCPKEKWPKMEVKPNDKIINEERKKTLTNSLNISSAEDLSLSKFSTYEKIIRIVAWIRRFLYNIGHKKLRKKGNLEVKELEGAEKMVLKIIQLDFKSDCENRLKSLRTYVDKDGLYRTKTQLFYKKDTEDFRSPVILPPKNEIVDKLIMQKHLSLCHCGTQTLLSTLREEYWLIRARQNVERVIRKCMICQRYKAKGCETPSIPLPEDRVREANIFEIVGVDFAGPLYQKDGSKTWILVYTCAIFRAVHLELVSNLSAENFILALRRIIARRGRPTIVYSDNASNFSATASALKRVDWEKIVETTTSQRIQWKFNPPSAPWWGGWWERLVGMLKRILRKVLGNASLCSEELSTILCECENILNHRPLTYLSENDEDLEPLTPALFIHEITDSSMVDLDRVEVNLSKRYLHRIKVRNDLRKRFRTEYLGQLAIQAKKIRNTRDIAVGDVVLMGSNLKKRKDWPLAYILQVYPGKDKHIRMAKIKTKDGIYLRPTKRLYPLEIETKKEKQELSNRIVLPQKLETSKIHNNETIIQDTDQYDTITNTKTRSGRAIRRPERLGIKD